MTRSLQIKLLPADATQTELIRQKAAKALGLPIADITGFHIIRKSIDARSRQPLCVLSLELYIGEPFQPREVFIPSFKDVHQASREVLIAGAGPAGLFAALKLLESGIKPVILERGKPVRERRRDLAQLNKNGIIDPDSNYCYGEGGAGTYSDGKLYTRSVKRGNVERVLQMFCHFGAEQDIMFDSHPHIGTNKLPEIISRMRELILDAGGEIHFGQKIQDLFISNDVFTGVRTAKGKTFLANKLLLCTGHSARDIFRLLHSSNILITEKPFALGVRVEHPQALIDRLQYHCESRDPFLQPASYSLVQQTSTRSVFSFCMCPGGIIAPASTDPGELVVNGWSPSKRNNPFANSGIVAQVGAGDWKDFGSHGPLAGMYYQRDIESRAYAAGGGNFRAPAQRMTDFVQGRVSTNLPPCSYLPGLHAADLAQVLPSGIIQSLKEAFRAFDHKMKGYYTHEAVVVAVESRTSSPVKIPRDDQTLEHPRIRGLYPCGEGAGYAGGIVSAAMDGQRVAEAAVRSYGR